MKDLNKFKLLLGSLCVSVLLTVVVPVPVYADGAIFYPDRSYGGTASDEFGVGSYTMSQMTAKGIGNDDAQSIQLTWPGYSAVCYSDDNFSGNSKVFTQRMKVMHGLENVMSSVKIQRGVPAGHVYRTASGSLPEFQPGYLYGTWELFYRYDWVRLKSSEGMCGYTVRYETEYWVNSGGIAQPTVEVISGQNVLISTSGSSDPGTCTGTPFPWEAYYWLDGEVYWENTERTTQGGEFKGCSYNLGIRDISDQSLPSPPATPSVPTGVSATAVTDGIEVSWDAASGATGYRVKRATVSGGPYTVLLADPVWMDTRVPDTGDASFNFTDSDMNESTTYFYKVCAVNACGDSADSSEVSATSNATVILSQGKTATASSYQSGNGPENGNDGSFSSRWAAEDDSYPQWWKVDLGGICDMNQVTINWFNASERSYKYKIEVSDDDVDYTMVVDQTARTATGDSTDNFIAAGRYVRVTVTGVSPSGGWAGFYECRVYGSSRTPPAAPANLVAFVYDDAINLDWDNNTEEDFNSYNVYRSTSAERLFTEIATGLLTSDYNDSNFVDNTRYYYVVTAVDDSNNESDYSEATILHFSGDLDYDGAVNLTDEAELSAGWQSVYDMNTLAEFSETWLGGIGLIAHWPLDADANDASGNLLHGISYGSVTWSSSGYIDGAADIDNSSNDSYIRFPAFDGITGKQSRTCAAWIKTSTTSGHIITWGKESPGSKWVVTTHSTGVLRVAVNGGYVQGSTDITDNEWHHIAVVLQNDGSPNIDEAKLYVDGQPEDISSYSSESVYTIADEDVTLGVYLPTPSYFTGLIDDVRIYDCALSPEEIENLAE